jgi:hypothetical protein
MKLRFRKNSLRLRVNQAEVRALGCGESLTEHVEFPGDARLSYILKRRVTGEPEVTFADGVITVEAPSDLVGGWTGSDEIGLYFELPANGSPLKVAIEKDLECVDGPPDERDPDAFPRAKTAC